MPCPARDLGSSDVPGKTGNDHLPAPTTRFRTADISRLLRTTDRTSRTTIMRQDPHAPHRRSQADVRVKRQGPRQPRHRSHTDLRIVRQGPHQSYHHFNAHNLGFVLKSGGSERARWVRFESFGAPHDWAGFVFRGDHPAHRPIDCQIGSGGFVFEDRLPARPSAIPAGGFVSRLSYRRITSMPSDRAGAVRGTIRGGLGAVGLLAPRPSGGRPSRARSFGSGQSINQIIKEQICDNQPY